MNMAVFWDAKYLFNLPRVLDVCLCGFTQQIYSQIVLHIGGLITVKPVDIDGIQEVNSQLQPGEDPENGEEPLRKRWCERMVMSLEATLLLSDISSYGLWSSWATALLCKNHQPQGFDT